MNHNHYTHYRGEGKLKKKFNPYAQQSYSVWKSPKIRITLEMEHEINIKNRSKCLVVQFSSIYFFSFLCFELTIGVLMTFSKLSL